MLAEDVKEGKIKARVDTFCEMSKSTWRTGTRGTDAFSMKKRLFNDSGMSIICTSFCV